MDDYSHGKILSKLSSVDAVADEGSACCMEENKSEGSYKCREKRDIGCLVISHDDARWGKHGSKTKS